MNVLSRASARRVWRLLPVLIATSSLTATSAPPSPSRELLSLSVAQVTPPLVLEPGQVVITFTFADTIGTQRVLRPMLARHGMHATFYVNSGRIGRGTYLTLAELRGLAEDGHEIASHTVDHENPAPLPPLEARHQVCDDRAALMALGFPITSFAYPFSGDTPTVRQIVIDCGFNNARATGGIRSPDGCGSCPPRETVPPQDTFIIRTPPSIKSSYTLADLQSLVLQAEAAGGGWVMISFHGICADCGTYGVTAELLESFLAWLAPRVSRGTFVRTTHQIIGGPVKPPVYADGGTPDAGMPDAGVPDAGAGDAGVPDAGAGDAGVPDGGPGPGELLPNPSLEVDLNGDNVPDCWKRINSGTHTGGWSRTPDAHSGSWAQKATITSYTSGERRLMIVQDSSACAPAVTPGRSYRLSAWYKTANRTGFVTAYRTSSGWVPWTSGPDLSTSSTYTRAEWVTPPVPTGALALSVGLSLRGAGSVTLDDFSLVDEAVPPPAPMLTLTHPNGGEALAAGTAYDITWASTGPWTTVDLSWSSDLGASWSPIAFAVPNSGRYTWTVPGVSTTRGWVRVTGVGSPAASDTSDAAFSIATATTGRVIPFGDVWLYEASGSDPGPLWHTASYADTAWPTGRGQLGYGDGDETTVLPRTSPSQTSVYFRKKISLSGPVSVAALRVVFDDGIAVWVNGSLAFSQNMGSGLAHARYASASTENATVDAALPPGLFIAGENVIGVMVKQAGPTSPDLSFDLQLDVTVPGTSPP